MPRLPPIALATLATVAAVLAGLPLRHTVLERTAALAPGTEILGFGPLVELLPTLAVVLLVGRLVLSFLPPGSPGSHRPRELTTTLACSYLLGVIALGAERQAQSVVAGLWPGARNALLSPWSSLAPWALLALGRLATLPGALVPRHEPRRERPDSLSRATLLGLVPMALAPAFLLASTPVADAVGERTAEALRAASGLLLVELVRAPDAGPALRLGSFAGALAWMALLALLPAALTTARRAPSGRRAVVLLFALTPAAVLGAGAPGPQLPAALAFGAGCAFLVPWLRRADRRGGALAAIAFGAVPLFLPAAWPLGAVGLAALLALTRGRRARNRLGGLVALVVLLVSAPSLWLGRDEALRAVDAGLRSLPEPPGSGTYLGALGRAAAERADWGVHWPLALTALVWGLFGLASLRRGAAGSGAEPELVPDAPGSGAVRSSAVDPPRNELAALTVVLAGALLLEAVLASELLPDLGRARVLLAPLEPRALLLLLAPAATLVAGLALARPERP